MRSGFEECQLVFKYWLGGGGTVGGGQYLDFFVGSGKSSAYRFSVEI